ncbi:hypothetical protein BIW11_09972 [Tropilaelaps mercedesae]|uniref:Uncharacterized protein n=1 Tax=Tropilaelaps mercedesae TaxID=418985 RepID=A0A1V9XHS7_9ACAR|nr:hypothetical protein BIW11_09972 [Tropilaelaps mercedesae]
MPMKSSTQERESLQSNSHLRHHDRHGVRVTRLRRLNGAFHSLRLKSKEAPHTTRLEHYNGRGSQVDAHKQTRGLDILQKAGQGYGNLIDLPSICPSLHDLRAIAVQRLKSGIPCGGRRNKGNTSDVARPDETSRRGEDDSKPKPSAVAGVAVAAHHGRWRMASGGPETRRTRKDSNGEDRTAMTGVILTACAPASQVTSISIQRRSNPTPQQLNNARARRAPVRFAPWLIGLQPRAYFWRSARTELLPKSQFGARKRVETHRRRHPLRQ